MTSKGNYIPCNNPPNPVPNVSDDPDSDPSFSYSSSSDSSDSSDDDYNKQKQPAEIMKRKSGVKHVLMTLPRIAQILQPRYLHPRKNQRSSSSNWMRIHYSAGHISYLSLIHFKDHHNLSKHTGCLWTIHT